MTFINAKLSNWRNKIKMLHGFRHCMLWFGTRTQCTKNNQGPFWKLGKFDSWLANFIKCIEVQDKKGLIYSATKLKLLQTKNFYTIISTIEKPFCGSVCTKTNHMAAHILLIKITVVLRRNWKRGGNTGRT